MDSSMVGRPGTQQMSRACCCSAAWRGCSERLSLGRTAGLGLWINLCCSGLA